MCVLPRALPRSRARPQPRAPAIYHNALGGGGLSSRIVCPAAAVEGQEFLVKPKKVRKDPNAPKKCARALAQRRAPPPSPAGPTPEVTRHARTRPSSAFLFFAKSCRAEKSLEGLSFVEEGAPPAWPTPCLATSCLATPPAWPPPCLAVAIAPAAARAQPARP